jgi:hypothetical protein
MSMYSCVVGLTFLSRSERKTSAPLFAQRSEARANLF